MSSLPTRRDAAPAAARWPGLSAALAISLALAPLPMSAARAQANAPATLIRDTEIEAILRQDADPIFAAAGLNPRDVRIHLVGDKEINAFAADGQNVFLYSGLITQTKTPNQLIGVIAHETGHIAGGHLARSGEANSNAMKTFLLTMGLGVLAALAGSPEGAAGLMYSSSYFATLSVLGYSRTQEAQADQAAATYLEKAHESGRGLVDFFDNYRYEEVFAQARRYAYFQTHPISSERIENLRARVQTQPNFETVDSPEAIERHAIMIAKLKAFINPPQQTLMDYKSTDTSFAARYARAIALYKATETDKALKAIDALIVDHPDDPYLYELKGQVLFESGRIAESEAPHRRSVELMPDAPLLQVNLGQSLLAGEDKTKADEAIAHIRKALLAESDNAFAWQLLARAYDLKGDAGMARLATAEQNFSLGQLRDARIFAVRARDLLDKTSPEWRRATDIYLASDPSKHDLEDLRREGSAGPQNQRRHSS